MDAIFKALNDPARRLLLDSLRATDGQSLSDLEAQLDMSRFGVMKHLNVLEDASLIVTRKEGRFKYHYLNAVPLQEVIDRWIEPLLAKPAARGLLDFKSKLESDATMPGSKPDLIQSTFIDCTHDALWDALTKGETIAKYHFATPHIEGDFKDGGTVVLRTGGGDMMLTQKVLRFEPKTLIEMTFELPGGASPSRCIYKVDPTDTGMMLTVEHYDLGPDQTHTREGWARWQASLKTLLESGKARAFPLQMG